MIFTMEVIEMKRLEENSIEALSNLLIDVVEEGASIGFLPPLSKENAVNYWKSVMKPEVIMWIAKLDNEICGTIQLHLAPQQNGSHRAEVAKLMVHPGKRRYGIGRTLMNTLEERAKSEGRSLLVLDTRSGDPSNVLYQSLGFIKAGVIPKYAHSANGELHDTVLYYKQI